MAIVISKENIYFIHEYIRFWESATEQVTLARDDRYSFNSFLNAVRCRAYEFSQALLLRSDGYVRE